MLPCAAQSAGAAEGRLILEDWHNVGADYYPTLVAWHANVAAAWDDPPPARTLVVVPAGVDVQVERRAGGRQAPTRLGGVSPCSHRGLQPVEELDARQ